MPDIYTKVKAVEYRNLLTQNESLKKENATLKAKIEKLESAVIEPEKEEITKKETKKGGNK